MIGKKWLFLLCFFILLPLAGTADQFSDMMDQYRNMGTNAGKNFPPALLALMPKYFTLNSKTFVFQETQRMVLALGLTGGRPDKREGGAPAEVNIGVMGYHPVNASYMAPTWQIMHQQVLQRGIMEPQKTHGNRVYGPLVKAKIGKADVYAQKVTHTNIELSNRKRISLDFWNAEAVLYHGNMMIQIRYVQFADSYEAMLARLKETFDVFLATAWNSHMN